MPCDAKTVGRGSEVAPPVDREPLYALPPVPAHRVVLRLRRVGSPGETATGRGRSPLLARGRSAAGVRSWLAAGGRPVHRLRRRGVRGARRLSLERPAA